MLVRFYVKRDEIYNLVKMVISDRITISHDICAGKPAIKGTRISVDFVIELLGNNWTHDDILENYPQLEKEDILAALSYVS